MQSTKPLNSKLAVHPLQGKGSMRFVHLQVIKIEMHLFIFKYTQSQYSHLTSENNKLN